MTKARLGGIRFVNSLPIEYALDNQIVTGPFDFFRSTPVELNRMMANHELDISPVSSIFLARNAADYLLIPDMAISSGSGVKSVMLFSRRPIEELMNISIGFNGKGETTPTLLRILCNFRYGFEPRIVPQSTEAELVIGDDALKAIGFNQFERYHSYDLAELWSDWTKLKFVFAVWLVRKNFFDDETDTFRLVHTALGRAKEWGLQNLPKIIQEAGEILPLPPDYLASYFGNIQYDVDEGCLKGLDHFYELAAELKILPQRVPMGSIASIPLLS